MMYYSCSQCGKMHPRGYVCNVNKRKWDNNRSKESKLRNTGAWHNKSKEIRERSNYLCAVCMDMDNYYNYKNIEVHHIRPIEKNPELLLDDKNLIALCPHHHKLADSGELNIDYLERLARKRDEKFQ